MKYNFENHEICSACGGECCKNVPGCVYPSDVEKPLKKGLKKLLKTGKYAIDWWEGDIKGNDKEVSYYIRPRTVNDKNKLFNAGWGARCILLTKKGCKLEHNDRPKECRMLKPAWGQECKPHGGWGKKRACIAWYRYNHIILEVAEGLENGNL